MSDALAESDAARRLLAEAKESSSIEEIDRWRAELNEHSAE